MRVVMFLPVLSYRGAERVALHLGQGLSKSNHNCTIFFIQKETPSARIEQNNKIKIILPSKIVQGLLKNKFINILLSQPILAYYAIKLVPQADIVHTESFPCLYIVLFFAKLYHKPCIWTIHAWQPEATSQSPLIQQLFHKLLARLDKIAANYTSAILTVSPQTHKQVIDNIRTSNVHMVIPPVNFDRLNNPDTTKIRQNYNCLDKNLLLCVGVLHPLKNQQLALKALDLVRKQIPNTVLFLIGGGDQKELTASAAQLNLAINKDVILTGFVPESELKNYYAAADIVLIPSIGQHEGLGITGFESLYLEKMCLAVENTGIADIFNLEQIGLTCKPMPSEFSQTIIKYLLNSAEYQQRIKSGKQFVETKLSTVAYANQIEKIYHSLAVTV